MYVPKANAWTDVAEVREFVKAVGAAELITVGADGFPIATLLPIVWEGDRLIAHFARANSHWEQIKDGDPVLVVTRGAQAYITPSWYAAKQEHGRVVPTWNYSAVHFVGRARIFEDRDSLLQAVSLLTDLHEGGRAAPWRVSDAPDTFIDGMLRGIVGVEVSIDRVDAKAKLSQNRPAADREGVIAGLLAGPDTRGEHQMAFEMARSLQR